MENKNVRQVNRANNRRYAEGNRYVDYCVYATLVCNFLILLGNPLKIDFLVSFGTRIMVVFILLLAILHFVKCFQKDAVDLLDALFVAVVVCSGICYIITTFPNVVARSVSYMCFLTLPAYITLYRNAKQVRKLKIAIYTANMAVLGLFIWLSFSKYSHIFYGEYGEEIIDELTLGYGNPNETGMYLFASFVIMLCAFVDSKKKTYKWITLAGTVILAYMVLKTESRICIVITAILIAVMVFRPLEKVLKKCQGIVLMLPLGAVAFTMVVSAAVLEWKFLGDLLDTGRKMMFLSFFNRAAPIDYVLGNYIAYGGSNLHNSFLSLTAMFGVPVTLLYFRFLKQALRVYGGKLNSRVSNIAFVGILAMIVHGIAEGTFLVAGAVFAGLGGLLFVLTLPDHEGNSV